MKFKALADFDFRSSFLSLVHLLAQFTIILIVFMTLAYLFSALAAFADTGVNLPGDDASSKMKSAGTLMHFIDTGLFRWIARILAGICIFAAGWNLKEMRFGPAFISLISAILIGTAPMWVKNIFSLGDSDSVFSSFQGSPNTRLALNVEHKYKTEKKEFSHA